MRNFLKGLLAIAIVAVVGVIVYTAIIYLDNNKQTNSTANGNQNNVLNNQSNLSKNEKEKDTNDIDKKDETVDNEQDNKQDNKQDNNQENKNEIVNEEVTLNDEEKAIELAKKEYGSTDGVYFRIEQIQSNNIYIVSVRDSQTTRDLAWYTVDLKNNTVK